MTEWKEVFLTEIATKIGDGLHGTPIYENSGEYYFINGNNLVNGKIIIKEDTKRVNESEYLKHAKPLNERTLLLGINGTIGNVAYYKNEKCMLGKSACYINLNNEVDLSFIYYIFIGKDFQNYIEGIATGTTIQNVPLKGIRDYSFKIPPLPEQTAIASILSSLDDKIDLLHRQNATLEKMAETLFRQWFVEEAKGDWEEGKLSDLVVVKYGKDHKKLLDGKIPVYGSGGIMRYADKALYNLESVLIPRKGTLSNVIYIDEPFWSVDTMFYTEMRKQNLAKFIFYFVKGLDLASMNVGSAVPSMTTEVLNNLPIDIPSDAFLEQFEQALAPLYKKLKSNQTQIRTLTALRDTLLPKLMSGEVNVEL